MTAAERAELAVDLFEQGYKLCPVCGWSMA
jgi:hypothetical protein